MSGGSYRRDVGLLSGGWALATTGAVILVSVTSLVGYELADDKSLATLPAGLMWLGTALATIPASFLMRRIGRSGGFMVGALIGGVAALLAALAVFEASFVLFCFGVMLIGAYNAFNYYFRFTAAEVAPDAFRSRAISLVLAGGVVSALAGPEIAKRATGLFPDHAYAGPFLAIAGLAAAIFVVAAFIRVPRPPAMDLRGGGRPMAEIARQPAYVVAVLGGVVAYGVMILLMSVTPLAMVTLEFTLGDAALGIQGHVLGMFLPSFFTGHLIGRFGVLTVMVWGTVLLAICIGVALAGVGLAHFWVSLTLLGVGWNFLFTGATTLLTETHTFEERAKAQGTNEFVMFGVAALASYLSGSLHYNFGWETLNLAALPLVLIALVATLWLARHRRAVHKAGAVAD